MRAAEAAAFARGHTAEELMDKAAVGIAAAVELFFPHPGRCIVFAGKGNNAGDAFASASLLRCRGWTIDLRLVFDESQLGELARKKLIAFHELRTEQSTLVCRGAEAHRSNVVVLDGLLGLGATPQLRDPMRAACREVNRLRRDENAFVFAIDLPSGLDSDSGETDADCVVADSTLAIGFAKRGLVAEAALEFVGRLSILDLPQLDNELSEPRAAETVATEASLRGLIPRRDFGAHKNQFGRVGILAGSKGLTGAAVLCSSGALRAGAGLVELFVPDEIYPIVATAAAPEAMVKPIKSYASLANEPVDVWGFGPGLGQENADEILQLIRNISKPMVVDADALNILSSDMSVLHTAAGPRLLTPHPGELKRLFPQEQKSRTEIAKAFRAEYRATLLFKGSRTIVAEADQPISYNSTGNPGMATGGMGDVLTGVCSALIAQKLSLYDAARLSAWLCGRAAEIAIFNGGASEQSLLPSDVLEHLGGAFRSLRSVATD